MKPQVRANYLPVLEACLIGLIAGLSAVALGFGVGYLGKLRIAISHAVGPNQALPICGFVGGIVAGLFVEFIAPEASGSGIPQVKALLNRMRVPLNLRVAIVKLVSGTISLGSGLFLGREGPTVQVGAALAAQFSRLLPSTVEHRRQLIAAGAGAGLTAAFNAPIAGVFFVLEELLHELKGSTLVLTILACVSASIIQNFFGSHYLHFTVQKMSAHTSFGLEDIPFYVLLALAAGICGALFNQGILGSLNLNRKLLKVSTTLRVGLAGLVSGFIISRLPEAFANYAGMRALIIAGNVDLATVSIAFFCFVFLTLIAYGSGAPGGLFAPSLAIGSALGYIVGNCEMAILGSASMSTFALVGMGAFFAAMARVPLTAIVIVFEMSGNFDLVLPLMLTCVLSSAVADQMASGPVYDLLMIWNGIHLHGPAGTEKLARELRTEDVMSRQIECVSKAATIRHTRDVLSQAREHGIPVVDGRRLVGVVTRHVLEETADTVDDSLPITKIMTTHPVTVGTHESLEDILFLFSSYHFHWLPVTKGDFIEGIITRSDVVQALFGQPSSPDPNVIVIDDHEAASSEGPDDQEVKSFAPNDPR